MAYIETKKDIFTYAMSEEHMFELALMQNSGYERKTTFYADLSIAEYFGVDSVKDTFDRVMESWIDDIKYITEFALCVNWKSWEMYDRYEKCGDSTYKGHYKKLGILYSEMYYDVRDKVLDHFKGNEDALHYYFETTD